MNSLFMHSKAGYILTIVLLFLSLLSSASAIDLELTSDYGVDALLNENDDIISTHAESAPVLLYRSLIYYNDRQFQNALDTARRSQMFEETPQSWQLIAMSAASLGMYQEASDAFQKVIKQKPDDPVVRNMHGASLTQLGEGKEAIEAFDRAISLDPEYAAAYNNLGVTYHLLKDYDKAQTSLQKAVKLKSEAFETSVYQGNLAWVYYAKKNRKMAEQTARAARISDHTNPYPYFVTGHVAFDREHYQEAYFSYQSCFSQITSAQQWYYAGISDFSDVLNRRKADLVDAYYKTVSANVNYPGSWDRTAVIEYKIKRYEQSLAYEFEKNLIIVPDYLQVWKQFGYAAIQIGKYQAALSAYEEALKLDKDDIEARIGYAHAIGKGGDYTSAMKALDDILAADPKNGWGYYSRGEVQLSYGKYDEAEADLKKALINSYPKSMVYSSLEKIAIANENSLLQTYYALRALLGI